jgi:fatty-acyl-CoA synthase
MKDGTMPAVMRAPIAKPSAGKAWLRALEMTAHIDAAPARTLPVAVEEWAARGDAPALLSEGLCLSYRELAQSANRMARWALAQDIAKGDVVAVMLAGGPAYLTAWLGLTRVGGVAALINTHLRGLALAHAVAVAAPKRIVAGDEYEQALREAGIDPALICNAAALNDTIARLSGAPLEENEKRAVTLKDTALLIYTSGTTGLSKAARVSHHRVMQWSHWFAGLTGATSQDRLYNCLPLYHSVGGVVAPGAMLAAGGAVVLREKFSARNFWDDIARWDCTIFQYIGELCRYLLQASGAPPPHKLRLAVGNGLGGAVWDAFQARFAIPQILEFYASTEGNFSLYNVEGKPGAIGRIPPFLAHRFALALVKFDTQAGLPARGTDGHCIRCARGEVVEAIGKIATASRFEGYTDKDETQKKILRDVFAPGDAWVRTGDLMRQDEQGFFYFMDRIGDTFRWKGENVATGEVAAAMLDCPGIRDVSVYGVAVPGAEGRAGMAAIVADAGFDPLTVRAHLKNRLPVYARPLFLRMVDSLAVTETFKQKKQDLARQGFDPAAIADPLYWLNPATGAYEVLDRAAYDLITSGKTRI